MVSHIITWALLKIIVCFCVCIATCEFLTKESLGISDSMSVIIINSTENRNPPITGDNITLLCLSGELMMTTCGENGEWEPNPSGFMCKNVLPSCKQLSESSILILLKLSLCSQQIVVLRHNHWMATSLPILPIRVLHWLLCAKIKHRHILEWLSMLLALMECGSQILETTVLQLIQTPKVPLH